MKSNFGLKQLVILNGGYGKRVKSISKSKPKCLIEFNGKPFLYWQIKRYEKIGIKEIILCLGYKNNHILNYIKKVKFKNIKLKIVIEKKLLGTGGAIKSCINYLDRNFMVTYGDSWLTLNLTRIKKKYSKFKNKNLITVIDKKKVVPHSANILIKKNNILDYKKNEKKYNYIDYGFIILNKNYFKLIRKKKFDLNEFLIILIKKKLLKHYQVEKKFYEIGSIKGIKEFKNYFKNEVL